MQLYCRQNSVTESSEEEGSNSSVTDSSNDFISSQIGIYLEYEDKYDDDVNYEIEEVDGLRYLCFDGGVKWEITHRRSSGSNISYSEASAKHVDSQTTGAVCSPNSLHRTRSKSNKRHTIMNLLKSFVGTAILFLPRAFANGGLCLSILVLLMTFLINLYCLNLLISSIESVNEVKLETYGDIAHYACGNVGLTLVNISLLLSQLGFCSIYGVFVAANLQDLIYSLSGCNQAFKIQIIYYMLVQIPLYVPLSWIRRIRNFAAGIIIADLFIVAGLIILITIVLGIVYNNGINPEIDFYVNTERWPLMVGTMVYVWEGIGLILPVRASMKDHIKSQLPIILSTTLSAIAFSYMFIGALCYIAYGKNVNAVIFLNLPATGPAFLLQTMYIVAGFLTYPLMLFPGSKILECAFLDADISGRYDAKQKWKKNAIRSFAVVLTLALGYFGLLEIDNFMAIIGAFCCLPLAIIYPCLFHFMITTRNPTRVAPDRLITSIDDDTSKNMPLIQDAAEEQKNEVQRNYEKSHNHESDASSQCYMSRQDVVEIAHIWRCKLFADLVIIILGLVVMVWVVMLSTATYSPKHIVMRCDSAVIANSTSTISF